MPLDVALVWNPQRGRADIAMAGPDLQTDSGLTTAVIISLFTDRLADAADVLPDNSANRRGWWGDQPISTAPTAAKPALIGSRLWLLDRALQTQETLNQARSYALEALQWMLDQGVAGSIDVTASYPQQGWIELAVTIAQQGASQTFNLAWQNS
jgi:phage gp46-like protein